MTSPSAEVMTGRLKVTSPHPPPPMSPFPSFPSSSCYPFPKNSPSFASLRPPLSICLSFLPPHPPVSSLPPFLPPFTFPTSLFSFILFASSPHPSFRSSSASVPISFSSFFLVLSPFSLKHFPPLSLLSSSSAALSFPLFLCPHLLSNPLPFSLFFSLLLSSYPSVFPS